MRGNEAGSGILKIVRADGLLSFAITPAVFPGITACQFFAKVAKCGGSAFEMVRARGLTSSSGGKASPHSAASNQVENYHENKEGSDRDREPKRQPLIKVSG